MVPKLTHTPEGELREVDPFRVLGTQLRTTSKEQSLCEITERALEMQERLLALDSITVVTFLEGTLKNKTVLYPRDYLDPVS